MSPPAPPHQTAQEVMTSFSFDQRKFQETAGGEACPLLSKLPAVSLLVPKALLTPFLPNLKIIDEPAPQLKVSGMPQPISHQHLSQLRTPGVGHQSTSQTAGQPHPMMLCRGNAI